MRITGGTLKGKTIKCPNGEIRPTMDRVRESLFSILGDLTGKSFLDLFGGSGICALEAVSRGAAPVTLIEKDKIKVPVILENVSIVPDAVKCSFMAAELYLKRTKDSFDYIYCDPPFPYKFHLDLLKTFAATPVAVPGAIILIHHPKEKSLPETVGSLIRFDSRVYGRSILDLYRKTTPETGENDKTGRISGD